MVIINLNFHPELNERIFMDIYFTWDLHRLPVAKHLKFSASLIQCRNHIDLQREKFYGSDVLKVLFFDSINKLLTSLEHKIGYSCLST